MQIISQFVPLPLADPAQGTAVAMGYFDGIHIGHRAVIDGAVQWARAHGAAPAVFTFRLPVDNKMKGKRLLSSADKHALIASLGVEYYLTPDFEEIKGLSPEQFVRSIPIQYALTYPKRVPGVVPELDFAALKVLTFDVADEETFRCLAACKKAIKKGGLGPCAANGANEEAVKLFLEDKIGFLDIGRLVEAVVDSDRFGGDYTLSDVYECDRMAREFVRAHL